MKLCLRPEGTNFRTLIPLGDRDLQRLEALATELSAEGLTRSPGQVGSLVELSNAKKTAVDLEGDLTLVCLTAY